jgi:serine protease Do
MGYLKLSLLGMFCFAFSNGFSQSTPESKKIEKMVAGVVDKAMATSVYIIEFDTLKNRVKEGLQENDGFSGVVVSPQGHIITVSHAATPNEVYQIRFADGSKHIAKGLGRLGIEADGTDYDMAMIKILKPGKWSFAKIGRIADLRLHQPLISISYPGSFYKQTPNVRFGRLTDADTKDGFISSTTKMEPGDSGGPLFDALGQVVGVHSWIRETEDFNYDVPAEFFLKYWNALNIAQDYKELPTADAVTSSPAVNIPASPALEEVAKLSPKLKKSAVKVFSYSGQQQFTVLGTLIDVVSSKGISSYIVSKSSLVANRPTMKVGDGLVSLQLIARDRENDLVLLKTDRKLDGAIRITATEKDPELSRMDLGKILISPLSPDSGKTGILSSVYTDLALTNSIGYIGANAVYNNEKITFSRIGKGSNSQLLQTNDQVVRINGVGVEKPTDYDREMNKYLAGDSISLDLVRAGKPVQVGVYLYGQPTQRHVSFDYPGGRSGRSDRFGKVMVQDAAIKAEECGGPVFDVNGTFYGINIARHSRTSSLIIPAGVLTKFIGSVTESMADSKRGSEK